MTKQRKSRVEKQNYLRRFFSVLGPGLITGAADDDPSGVATYSIAGAQLGTSMLWSAFITWPLMGCVQFMCARIGMVTGRGLAGALRKKFPRWVLVKISWRSSAPRSVLICFSGRLQRKWRRKKRWVAECCGSAKARRDEKSIIENSTSESAHFSLTW